MRYCLPVTHLYGALLEIEHKQASGALGFVVAAAQLGRRHGLRQRVRQRHVRVQHLEMRMDRPACVLACLPATRYALAFP